MKTKVADSIKMLVFIAFVLVALPGCDAEHGKNGKTAAENEVRVSRPSPAPNWVHAYSAGVFIGGWTNVSDFNCDGQLTTFICNTGERVFVCGTIVASGPNL